MQPPELYPRSFFVISESGRYRDGCISLPDELEGFFAFRLPGFCLFTHKWSEVDLAVDNTRWIAVIGKAWFNSSSSMKRYPSPAWQLLSLEPGTDQFHEALYDLSGRYCILFASGGHLYLYNDAGGTRSVFWDHEEGTVASHFDILRLLRDPNASPHHEVALPANEVYWDTTPHDSTYMLIPNHFALLEESSQHRFYPLRENPFRCMPTEEKLGQIEEMWSFELEMIRRRSSQVVLSVTGGLDSRTLLALAKGLDIQTFTYTTVEAEAGRPALSGWGSALEKDFQIVERLRQFLPQFHKYLLFPTDSPDDPGKKWVLENAEILARNSLENHGRTILPGYIQNFDAEAIHYRGSLMEIGQLWWGTPGVAQEQSFEEIIRIKSAEIGKSFEDVWEFSVPRLFALDWDEIHPDYHLCDIFYWEQREGRWYSQVLNETDVAFDTITPINSRRMMDLFLSFNEEERKSAFAQKELIYRNNPFLLFQGINRIDDYYQVHGTLN